MSTRYTDEFFKLKAAPDILAATKAITNGTKEITESMSIIHAIRHVTLSNKMNYSLVDMCSGNALVPIIAAHLLPVRNCISVDKRLPKSSWTRVKRLYSLGSVDIMSGEKMLDLDINKHLGGKRAILTSVHPCGKLAEQVINIFLRRPQYRHLYMMPCCSSKINHRRKNNLLDEVRLIYSEVTTISIEKAGEKIVDSYVLWCLHLANLLSQAKDVRVSMRRDPHCLSEKNIIITATKE